MLPVELLHKVREQNPLVHNITNIVVANDSANGLLAIGASPFMSNTPAEMAEVAKLADVVVLNMGTLDDQQLNAMKIAGKTCNEFGKPVVLDPVGAGATTYRKKAAETLLHAIQFDLIKGNAGEIAALAGAVWQAKGVDAGDGEADLSEIAKTCARKYHAIVAVSGKVDVITDGHSVIKIENGTEYFTKMTGAGCLLSCICGAFLAVAEKNDYLAAAATAVTMYGLAGEITAEKLPLCLNGSFRTGLLDELSVITAENILEGGKINDIDQ